MWKIKVKDKQVEAPIRERRIHFFAVGHERCVNLVRLKIRAIRSPISASSSTISVDDPPVAGWLGSTFPVRPLKDCIV